MGHSAFYHYVPRRPPGTSRLMALPPERAERLAEALRASLDAWIEQVEAIAENAHPTTGNLSRALHLQRSLMQAKQSLDHLLDPTAD